MNGASSVARMQSYSVLAVRGIFIAKGAGLKVTEGLMLGMRREDIVVRGLRGGRGKCWLLGEVG